jgi:hypothetical protein
MSHANVKHEAKRRASEVLTVRGKQLTAKGGVLPRGVGAPPGLRAVGTMAFASIYSDTAEERARPPVLVERKISRALRDDTGERHQWITCSERFRSLERARAFASFQPELYRVVVLTASGDYAPDLGDVVVRPSGKGARGFW